MTPIPTNAPLGLTPADTARYFGQMVFTKVVRSAELLFGAHLQSLTSRVGGSKLCKFPSGGTEQACRLVPDSPIRILIVDDTADDAFFTARLLESIGIAGPIAVADSGPRAMEVLAENPHAYDLVFLDVHMPQYDGFAILDWIRQRADLANLRVVMLTTSTDERDVERAHRLGADGFVVKYPSKDKLAAILSNIPSKVVGPLGMVRASGDKEAMNERKPTLQERVDHLTRTIAFFETKREEIQQRRRGAADPMMELDECLEVNGRTLEALRRSLILAKRELEDCRQKTA